MKKLILLMSTLIGFHVHANATIVTADFTTKSDLPYCIRCAAYRQGPLTLQSLGQGVGSGVELDAMADYANPSAWLGGIVHIDLDPVAKTITLLSQDDYDFEFFSAAITNIKFSTGEVITGLKLLSNDLTEDYVIEPVLFFTGNSLLITYDSPDGFYFTGRNAVFEYSTQQVDAAVPEPGTAALLLAGGALLFGRRRIRR